MSYGVNAARRRMGYGMPSLATTNMQFEMGWSYTKVRQVLGDAAEDLGWSIRNATLEQKVEMWQAWEAFFCDT